MLSVYHHSVGRSLELRGAPAILLPPEVEPMALEGALETLADDRQRLLEAIWTVARSVPPARPGVTSDTVARRYPRELRLFLNRPPHRELRDRLEGFDELRVRHRREAHLYAAALIAYAQSEDPASEEQFGGDEQASAQPPASLRSFLGMREQFAAPNEATGSLDQGTKRLGLLGKDTTFSEFLHNHLPRTGDGLNRARGELRKLERELGINLETYVQEFADVVAFSDSFGDDGAGAMPVRVFPASSVTRQDAATLQTQVTVTALVATELFDCLRIGMDPQCWSLCSDAFGKSAYVAGSHDLSPVDPALPAGAYGREREDRRLLEEHVTLVSQADGTEIGSFHNILNIRTPIRADGEIEIRFDLNRSISSRILWDERAGGIIVNEGYLRAQPVAENVWRVTSRKTLRFSDRTPNSGGGGWNDHGQMLNYLAPAALSSWIESEMYSARCPRVLEMARAAQTADQGEQP